MEKSEISLLLFNLDAHIFLDEDRVVPSELPSSRPPASAACGSSWDRDEQKAEISRWVVALSRSFEGHREVKGHTGVGLIPLLQKLL